MKRVAATAGVVRAILRNPSLRRVGLAFFLFNAVEYGTWVAILLYAYDASGPGAVGVVALAQLLPAALVAPVAASLADRFNRRRVLLGGYLVQAAAFGVTAAGMLAGAPPAVVYLAAAAAASSLTVTRPAQGALLPSLSRTPEELTAANGLSGTLEGTGVLVGPLTAAAILAVASPGAVFAAGAAACLAAAALVVRLPRAAGVTADGGVKADGGAADARRDEAAAESPGAIMAGGLRALTENGDTRLVVAILGLRMLTAGAMDVLFVLLALEVFGTGDSGAGILNAALGLGTVIGGAASFALVGLRRLGRALALSALVWGGAIVVLGAVASPWVAPLVIAVGGVGLAAVDVAGRTILQRVTPDRLLGRALGALEGVGLVALAIGSVLVPVVAGAVGIQAALVAVGLVLPVSVGAAWLGLRRIDRRVSVPLRELALLGADPILGQLAPPELEAVARRARWLTVEIGKILVREGDSGDRYYVLESGVVRITRAGATLRTGRGPGYGFGEIALLRDVPRTATVTAMEPCILLVLERADFLEAVTGHSQAHAVARSMAELRMAAGDADGLEGDPPA